MCGRDGLSRQRRGLAYLFGALAALSGLCVRPQTSLIEMDQAMANGRSSDKILAQRVIRPRNIPASGASLLAKRELTPGIGAVLHDDDAGRIVVTDFASALNRIERAIRDYDKLFEVDPETTLVIADGQKMALPLMKIQKDTGVLVIPVGSARGATVNGLILGRVPLSHALFRLCAQDENWGLWQDQERTWYLGEWEKWQNNEMPPCVPPFKLQPTFEEMLRDTARIETRSALPEPKSPRKQSETGEPLTTLVFNGDVKMELVLMKLAADTGLTVVTQGAAKNVNLSQPLLRNVTVREALKWICAERKGWVFFQASPTEWVICDRGWYDTLKQLPPGAAGLSDDRKPLTSLWFEGDVSVERVIRKIQDDTGITVTAEAAINERAIAGPKLPLATAEEAAAWLALQDKKWTYRRDDTTGGWKIADEQAIDGRRSEQRRIVTANLGPESAKKAVEPMLTAGVGHIGIDGRIYGIVVEDYLPVVNSIERVLRILDQKVGNDRTVAQMKDAREPIIVVERPGQPSKQEQPETKLPASSSPRKYIPLVKEDFNERLALDWEVLHRDESHYSLEKVPGALTITTQRGGLQGPHQIDYENLFLIDAPDEGDEPYEMTVCFSWFQPGLADYLAGLVLYQDDNNYMRATFQRCQANPFFIVDSETGGRFNYRVVSSVRGTFDRVWLRLTRDGDRYELETSTDGKTFTTQGAADWGVEVRKVGLLAMSNSSAELQEFDVAFDSFEIVSLREGAENSSRGDAESATVSEDATGSMPSAAIPEKNLEVPTDCEACAANLRKMSDAIQKYKAEKGELPDWLSTLVPDYLPAAALLCPADAGVLSPLPPDPKLDCSYGYQLPPVVDPMVGKEFRTWKTEQRALYGDVVPLVRCGHHGDRFLNLSWAGEVYVSRALWENLFDAQVKERAVAIARPNAPKPAPVNEKYENDLRAFIDEMNRTYPHFDLKGIRAEWEEVSKRLLEEVKTCNSDEDFLDLVMEAIRCLRDGHMGFTELNAKFRQSDPEYTVGVTFLPATENRVCVMYARDGIDPGLKSGTVVTKIDGKDARTVLDGKAKDAWKAGGSFSSPQRARMYEYRIPLRGKQGDRHTISILADGKEKAIELTCDQLARGWPHTYNMPDGLNRVGRSSYYALLPSGVGYVYLRRVDESVVPCLKEAVATHANAKGWIIDLRGNGGGGYGADLFEQLSAMPKPVAGIIDAGTFSAGETLARDVVRMCDAQLFGSNTAGSSGRKRGWAFPSGIGTLTVPVRSWGGLTGPVEFNGIAPNVKVEADPEEVAAGHNSAILRAEEYLLKSTGATGEIVRPTPRPTPATPQPKFDISSIPGDVIFKSRYQHRSRNRDYLIGDVTVKRQADGHIAYVSDVGRYAQIIETDAENNPLAVRLASADGSYELTANLGPGRIERTLKRADQADEQATQTVSAGALPDFNSRPDPYCTQHVLLRHYDLDKGGKQTFTVFDVDSTGKAFAEYEVELEYVGEEDVTVPAGQCKARHIVLKQLTRSNTWYKKFPGLVTDFWIGLDDYTIYRIYRHREPYELLLIEAE